MSTDVRVGVRRIVAARIGEKVIKHIMLGDLQVWPDGRSLAYSYDHGSGALRFSEVAGGGYAAFEWDETEGKLTIDEDLNNGTQEGAVG